MKKKNILISLTIVAIIAIIATIVFVVQPFRSNEKEVPKPITTAPIDDGPRDIEKENASLEKLLESNQYQEALEQEHAYLYENGDLKTTHTVYAVLGAYTVDKYIENAISNPYFITGYWKEKDKYKFSSIDTYISPYISDELRTQFEAAAQEPESEAFNAFYASKIAFPATDLQISPQCYDTWETEACFPIPPRISDMSIEGISEKSVKINAVVSLQVIYQKPDSPEGNLIYQDVDYTLSFILSENSASSNSDTELPIMVIDNITATLDIKGNTDYLINVAE